MDIVGQILRRYVVYLNAASLPEGIIDLPCHIIDGTIVFDEFEWPVSSSIGCGLVRRCHNFWFGIRQDPHARQKISDSLCRFFYSAIDFAQFSEYGLLPALIHAF